MAPGTGAADGSNEQAVCGQIDRTCRWICQRVRYDRRGEHGRTGERHMTVVPDARRVSQEERITRPVIDCAHRTTHGERRVRRVRPGPASGPCGHGAAAGAPCGRRAAGMRGWARTTRCARGWSDGNGCLGADGQMDAGGSVKEGRGGGRRTPTSLRTIHGACFSVSASGTDAGSIGPNGDTDSEPIATNDSCLNCGSVSLARAFDFFPRGFW